MKKWITFDLDETLMKNPFQKWVFPEIKELVMEASNNKMNIIIPLVARHKTLLEKEAYATAYNWDEMLMDVLAERDIALNIDIEALVKKHAVIPKVYLLEDHLIETFKQLNKRGFSLAVITNGLYKYQFPVLQALGIDGSFDEIITPTETGVGKPDLRMANKLLDTGEVVAHVGDRLDHDVSFSNQLGAYSILIDKNMPENIRAFSLEERNGELFYQQKWQAYAGEAYCPKAIIHSINELLTMNQHGALYLGS